MAQSNAELREAILKAFGVESDEQYVDNKAKFLIEDLMPLFQSQQQQLLQGLMDELPKKQKIHKDERNDGYGSSTYYKNGRNIAIDQVKTVIQNKLEGLS